MGAIASSIEQLIELGRKAVGWTDYYTWTQRVSAFLRAALGEDVAREFLATTQGSPALWQTSLEMQIGMLEGILAVRTESDEQLSSLATTALMRGSVPISKRVFVVHGHDNEAKQTVARFLERLGLAPIILHEQPSEGRTVIEKIEALSDVGFAVVLLTPDDVGAAKDDAATLRPRARQNVVLELGYFLGKLKRSRVCALYKPGVEIPSDFSGVLYVELDAKGAWHTSLAQELSNARVPINVEGLLGS